MSACPSVLLTHSRSKRRNHSFAFWQQISWENIETFGLRKEHLAVSNFNTFQWYFDLVVFNLKEGLIPESLKIRNSMIINQAEKTAFNKSLMQFLYHCAQTQIHSSSFKRITCNLLKSHAISISCTQLAKSCVQVRSAFSSYQCNSTLCLLTTKQHNNNNRCYFTWPHSKAHLW